MSEPLPDDELGRSFESRSALSSDLGSLTQSVFVTGTPDGLSVEARVVPSIGNTRSPAPRPSRSG